MKNWRLKMHSYIENYGEDIDGNRGQKMWFHEIDDDDEEEIKAQVQEYLSTLEEDEDPDSTLDIVLIRPITEEDVYFTIRVADYV